MGSVVGFLKMVVEIFNLVKEGVSLYKKARREGWLQEGKEITKSIREAKSDADRKKLVKALAKHTRRTP